MGKQAAGTFKVSAKRDGSHVLVGIRQDGSRVRFKVGSLTEGHTLGRSIFEGAPTVTGSVVSPTLPSAPLDDFGLPTDFKLPKVSPQTVAAGAPATPATALPTEARKGDAKSLAELIGLGGAMAPVYLANKFLEPRYEVVPKPSKKHLNDLANEITAAITESFGDREVGHWTMAILLAIGIPLSMFLQSSGPKKRIEEPERQPLSSVP